MANAMMKESEQQLSRCGAMYHDTYRRTVYAACLLHLLGESQMAVQMLFPRDTAPRLVPDLRRLLAVYVWRIATGEEID